MTTETRDPRTRPSFAATPVQVGDRLTVYGVGAIVRTVLPAGTVDVERDDGRWYRVSGLAVPLSGAS